MTISIKVIANSQIVLPQLSLAINELPLRVQKKSNDKEKIPTDSKTCVNSSNKLNGEGKVK